MKFKNILNGWRNNLIPPKKLKDIIKKVQDERLKECIKCPNNSTKGEIKFTSTCLECGCVLKAKTACMEEQCPLTPPKWSPICTEEEGQLIEQQLKDLRDED